MSLDQIQADLGSLARTIPARSTATDFAYGDRGEVLALVSAQLESLQVYCWNCLTVAGIPSCHSRYRDAACSSPSYDPDSVALTMLDAYGLSGTIQYSYIDPATAKAATVSLLPQGAQSVPFCSAFQNPSQVPHSRRSYFDTYPSMLTAVKRAEVDCKSRRELPAAAAHSPLLIRLGEARRLGRKLEHGPQATGDADADLDSRVRLSPLEAHPK